MAEILAMPIQDLVPKLFKVFKEADATLLEINPLAITSKRNVHDKASIDDIVCVDAKIEVDDASAFRHPEYFLGRSEDGANHVRDGWKCGVLGEWGRIGNGNHGHPKPEQGLPSKLPGHRRDEGWIG